MQFKPIVALLLALAFIMAPAAAFAEEDDISHIGHTVAYDMDGTINYLRQAGHFCNSGAEMQQTISGTGAMTKNSGIILQAGYIKVDDDNDWVTAADALSNLTVTTAIRLCAPAKHVYGDEEVPIDESDYYDALDGAGLDAAGFEALTDQIWAVQVMAEPGYAASLSTDFQAAYGKYEDRGVIGYPGEFFRVNQTARTEQGTLRRYIDISSMRSHGYLHEDLSVTGKSYVRERFNLNNRGAKKESRSWYDLF
jgi:hypothetical protein